MKLFGSWSEEREVAGYWVE